MHSNNILSKISPKALAVFATASKTTTGFFLKFHKPKHPKVYLAKFFKNSNLTLDKVNSNLLCSV